MQLVILMLMYSDELIIFLLRSIMLMRMTFLRNVMMDEQVQVMDVVTFVK